MNLSPVNYNIKNNNYLKNNDNNSQLESGNDLAFKKGPGKVTKFTADTYGKFMLNNKGVRKFSEGFSKLDKNDASRHFQVMGSAVTSFAYMNATLKNKDIEKKNARTLSINQLLGFVVPTGASYLVDAGMRNFNKSLEYAYSAAKEKEIALGKLDKAAKEKAVKALGNNLKGFRCLIGIATFTSIYRFIVPVAITPTANKFGNWLNAKIDEKDAKKQYNAEAFKDKLKPEANKINTAA